MLETTLNDLDDRLALLVEGESIDDVASALTAMLLEAFNQARLTPAEVRSVFDEFLTVYEEEIWAPMNTH